MMQTVLDDFERRVDEINAFFNLLKRLDDPNTALCNKSDPRRVARAIEEDCIKVMKATAFLLIYNLVESGIRSALNAVYERIVADGRRIEEVRGELRQLWIQQRHSEFDIFSASPRTYKEVAERLVDDVLAKTVIKLDAQDLPGVSGNLDAAAIRTICKRHGISFKAHYVAKGGDRLLIVKEQRNALAHGEVSFAECGRQHTVEDLVRIKQQAVVFVRSIVRNIKKYAEKQEYAA